MNITVLISQNSLITCVQYLSVMSYNKTVEVWDGLYHNLAEMVYSLINSTVITGVVNTNPWLDILITTPSIMH